MIPFRYIDALARTARGSESRECSEAMLAASNLRATKPRYKV